MKKLLLIILILSTVFSFGCSNKDNSSNTVKLNKVDISALSNQKIKNIIDDTSLEEGVYQINTKSNTYIYFYGIENEFTDIGCSIEDNTLNISATSNALNSSDNSSFKKLFVIYQKNTTISDDKTVYFDKINLTIDDKNTNFKNSIVID
ncbi:MAG: hypothetical protein ACI4PU_10675 [Intestinibacter sp.]